MKKILDILSLRMIIEESFKTMSKSEYDDFCDTFNDIYDCTNINEFGNWLDGL